MRPNFQGLLLHEFDGLGEDELKILFLLSLQSKEAVAVLFLVNGHQFDTSFICRRQT
jgi:hypothetical protein